MRIGAIIHPTPHAALARDLAEYATRIEASGFPGIWVGDSLGRGRATLDPLTTLAALAAVTERVELGVAVIQVPLRNPVELAHRVQSLQALSGNRLRLGVGSGSTKADFDLIGADFEQRFKTLMRSLDIMRLVWRGEPVNDGALSAWPGTEGGPPILLGAWRNARWIAYAATACQGWTASGRFSRWEDLERGMRLYREAGGTRAVLSNVAVDFSGSAEAEALAKVSNVCLIGSPEEARGRLKRLQRMSFDEVLLVSHSGTLDDLKRARDLL